MYYGAILIVGPPVKLKQRIFFPSYKTSPHTKEIHLCSQFESRGNPLSPQTVMSSSVLFFLPPLSYKTDNNYRGSEE
jgi:hypothetical protein